MKRTTALLMSLLTIFLIFTFCSCDNNIKDKSADDYISMYKEKVSGVANENNSSYAIPLLNINSTYADTVNNEIKKALLPEVKEFELTEKSTAITLPNLEYDFWLNDNILTLIITKPDYIILSDKYLMYNIDVNSGEEIDNKKIAEKASINADKIDGMIKAAFEKEYNGKYKGGPAEITSAYDETVNAENISKSKLYLDKDGNASVFGIVYSGVTGTGAQEFLNLQTN